MKKLLAILLALAMVLSLAACGASEAPATEAPATATEGAAPATEAAPAPAADPVTLTWGSWVFAEDSVNYIYQEMADLYNETNEYNTTIDTSYF